MGITYQTNNRLRRKVMTAPLTLPENAQPAEVAPEAPVVQRSMRLPLWPIAAAAAAALAYLAANAH